MDCRGVLEPPEDFSAEQGKWQKKSVTTGSGLKTLTGRTLDSVTFSVSSGRCGPSRPPTTVAAGYTCWMLGFCWGFCSTSGVTLVTRQTENPILILIWWFLEIIKNITTQLSYNLLVTSNRPYKLCYIFNVKCLNHQPTNKYFSQILMHGQNDVHCI